MRTPHEEAPVAEALKTLIAQDAELLLVVGASAVVDRRDVGPAGIVRAGGDIPHFGMPVIPATSSASANRRHRRWCCRAAPSPKLNGIDWVLHRLFAGLPVTPTDVMRDGRRRPAEGDRRQPPVAAREGACHAAHRHRHRAARQQSPLWSRRRTVPPDGAHNKLLVADRTGKSMIARVVDNVLSPTHGRCSSLPDTRPNRCSTRLAADLSIRPRTGLCGRPVRQPEGRLAAVPGVRRSVGVPGRHAAGDRTHDRQVAGCL